MTISEVSADQSILTADGSDGETELELQLLDTAIAADSGSWCSLHIEIGNSQVAFSAGDTITVSLFKDMPEPTVDMEIWQSSFHVSGNYPVSQTMDCSTSFQTEIGDTTTGIYAAAVVDKDDCGFGCFNDEPVTDNIVVNIVEDDEREPDDALEDAAPLMSARQPPVLHVIPTG